MKAKEILQKSIKELGTGRTCALSKAFIISFIFIIYSIFIKY